MIHHDYSNSYKGNNLIGSLTVSEVLSMIIMEEHGDMQADLVLEKVVKVNTFWSSGNKK